MSFILYARCYYNCSCVDIAACAAVAPSHVAQLDPFAMASVRDSVAALVADGRYGDIAAVCEKAEVEVRLSRGRSGGQLQPVVVVVASG